MIIEQKEINKFINEGLRSIKKGVELARKNIVVEVIKQAPKVRKKRTQVQVPPAPPAPTETPKVRRPRKKKGQNLINVDSKGYMTPRTTPEE